MAYDNPIRTALLLGMLLAGNTGLAGTCNEPSPNLLSLGDGYYDLDVAPPTSEERRAVLSLARKMAGHWSGEGQLLDCTGPDEQPTPENREMHLTAEIALDATGTLQIRTEKYFQKERMRLNDTLVLFSNLAEQAISIIPDGFEVTEKFRSKTNEQYLPLTERIYRLAYRSPSRLTYRMRVYINGRLTTEEHWQLSHGR